VRAWIALLVSLAGCKRSEPVEVHVVCSVVRPGFEEVAHEGDEHADHSHGSPMMALPIGAAGGRCPDKGKITIRISTRAAEGTIPVRAAIAGREIRASVRRSADVAVAEEIPLAGLTAGAHELVIEAGGQVTKRTLTIDRAQ
jgi:hypothetical protein